MVSVESCCCGCSLRVGTLILLWIGAINFSLGIIGGAAESIHSDVHPFFTLLRVLYDIIVSGIHLMGIYGVEKKKPSYLIPYLGFLVFFMVMLIISMVALATLGAETFDHLPSDFQDKKYYYKDNVAIFVDSIEITLFLILALFYYFFVVVRSYYNELKRETDAIVVYKC